MSNVIEQQCSKKHEKAEVNIIPKGWSISNLGSLGSFKNGINKDGSSFGHGYPLVNLMDVFGRTSIGKIESFGLINSSDLDKKEYDLREGDVLFIRSSVKPSGVGLTAVVKENLQDTVYSGFLIRFRSDLKLSTAFKEHCFYDYSFRKKIIAASSVSANTNINQDNLQKLLLTYPQCRDEQKAIANALSDVDALITSLEKLIAKKRAIKTAAMQQLLTGKKRLPPFDNIHTGYKQTELGEIPADWDVERLGAITTFIGSGKTNTKGNGDIPLYGSTGQIGTCKIYEYEGPSILIARVGANAGRLNFVDGFYGVSDNTIIIKFGASSNEHFYKYQLIRMNLNSLVFGSGQPLLTGSQLKRLFVPVPKLEEQTAIERVLSDIDLEIEKLEKRVSKTKQLKQGMMQELLTGRTRLV